MITVSGAILSALIDEANSCAFNSVQHGVLFGSRISRRTEVLSDTQEEKVVDEYSIGTRKNSRSAPPLFASLHLLLQNRLLFVIIPINYMSSFPFRYIIFDCIGSYH